MADISQSQAQSYDAALDATLGGDVGDYLALLKPRVMFLVVFTGLAGMVAAPEAIHPVLAIAALLCIAVGSGAAGALNMWYDADIDARMTRTASRPIPRGRVEHSEAVAFGIVLSIGAVMCLGLMVNWLSAALLAGTIGFYVGIYTMWLKRSTPQNIVIGGAAGAMPPVIGWAAATDSVTLAPIVLFLIIFIWTPPHFWALALYRSGDYARVGVPMMPVVAGEAATRRQILIYSLILAPLGCVPAFIGLGGVFYLAASAVLGALFVVFAVRCWREREGDTSYRASKQLFAYSVLYLFLLFAVLLVEHAFGIGGGPLPPLWTV
ncbi:heme o synthase [Methyloligella sp. 2.7D]|uniref:heme o synthase n=1 Tax=unclassified Methyloligella TaxID=2625955 RepID=UPI00157E2348|nr:heme o synthase [Methyloligella sp. GL2]QKP78331.1 protoheme IX farnesyltransferase [Methyloligella sp. GL2]